MAESITIKALQDASLDAKSLEDVVNGDEAKQVTTRLGETYPSVKKAIKTLFENGGLPATPFKTYALMTASDLPNDSYAVVTNDADDSKNIVYIKTAGAWTASKYDPLAQARTYADSAKTQAIADSEAYTDSSIAVFTSNSVDDTRSHVFVDKDSKLIASFNSAGEFDFYPSDATAKRLSDVEKNDDDEFIYLVLDSENRILDGIDKYGNKVVESDEIGGSEMPLKTPLTNITSTVKVKAFDRVIKKMDVNTVAKGRTTDPDIVVNGNGLTHPKMIYIPEGWNGYKYWLTATPVYGVIPKAAYENPHIWASNDLTTWVEPSGAPLDLPENENTSYWSDSHLALDDDGWLYCIYRGCDFSFASTCIVAKRSRDGVNWSERIMIYNASNEPVSNGMYSPAIFKNGTKWQCIDVLVSLGNFTFGDNYSRGVFRRSSDSVTGKYEPYNINQLVNYINPIWGSTHSPWHIDAMQVGNMYLQLISVGKTVGGNAGSLYLAWSSDGWNFTVLPRLNTHAFNAYRSSITLKDSKKGSLWFDVIVARTDIGEMDLFTLTLEIN